MSKKLLKAAKAAIQAEDYAKALQAANELLDSEPDHFHGLIFAAVAHAKLGDFDNAQQRYKDALAADPTQAAAHQGLAELYETRMKENEDAEDDMLALLKETYNKLLSMQGDTATIKGELVLGRLARVEDKLEHFQTAVELSCKAAAVASEPAEKLRYWTRIVELTLKREVGLDKARRLRFPDPVARRRAILDEIENDPVAATAPIIHNMFPLVEQGLAAHDTIVMLVKRVHHLWTVNRMDARAAVRAFDLGIKCMNHHQQQQQQQEQEEAGEQQQNKGEADGLPEILLALCADLACDDDASALIDLSHDESPVAALTAMAPQSDVTVSFKIGSALRNERPTTVDWAALQEEAVAAVERHADTRDVLLLRKRLAQLQHNRDDHAGADAMCKAALDRIAALKSEAAGRRLKGVWEWFTVMHAVTRSYLDTLHLKQHQTTLAAHPDNAFAQAGLSRIMSIWNKRDLATMHAEAAVAADPACGGAHAALATARCMCGDVDAALGEAKSAVQMDPACADHHFKLGLFLALHHQRAAVTTGDTSQPQAEQGTPQQQQHSQSVSSALEIDPSLPIPKAALRPWLTCLRITCGHSDALYYIGCYYASTNKDKAVRCFAKALEAQPLHAKASRALWLAHMRDGRRKDADELVRSLAALPGSDRLPWVWMRKAMLELADGYAGKAVVSLQTALRVDTGSALLWQLLGEAYHRRGSYLAALKALDQSIARDPHRLHTQYMKGLALLRLGDEEEAMAAFEKVLEVDNTHGPATEGLASALHSNARTCFRTRRPELCLSAINRTLQVLAPALRTPHPYICLWKLCGDAYDLATQLPPSVRARVPTEIFHPRAADGGDGGHGDNDAGSGGVGQGGASFEQLSASAAAAYARVIRANPSAEALCDLAVNRWRLYTHVRARTGCGQDALLKQITRLCMQALTLDKGYTEAWNMLGIAAFASNDHRLAYNAFASAADASPSSASTWVHIGALLMALDSIPYAHRAFTQAQMLDPGKSRAWVGQAVVAAGVQHTETLDLFRHALQLYPHGMAARGFAYYTLEALQPKQGQAKAAAQDNSGGAAQGRDDGGSSREGSDVDSSAVATASHGPTWTGDVPFGCKEQYLLQGSTALVALAGTAAGSDDACVYNMCAVLYERLQLYARAEELYREALAMCQQQHHRAVASAAAETPPVQGGTSPMLRGEEDEVRVLEERVRTVKHNLARCLALQRKPECLELFAEEDGAERADTSTLCLYAKALFEQGDVVTAFQVYGRAREGTATERDRAEITASMAVVAFANDEIDLAKQLLAEATQDPGVCTPAIFITAALGLFANDLQLAEAALAYGPQLWSDGSNTTQQFVAQYLRLSAFAYAMAGAPTVSRSFLLQLIHIYPQQADTWLLLAQVLCGGTPTPSSASAAVVALRSSVAPAASEEARETEAAALLARGIGADAAAHTPVPQREKRQRAAKEQRQEEEEPGTKGGEAYDGSKGAHTEEGADEQEQDTASQASPKPATTTATRPKSVLDRAVSSAMRGVHLRPTAPEAWCMAAVARLARGTAAASKQEVERARVCCERAVALTEEELQHLPPLALSTPKQYQLTMLLRWCHLTWCECGLALHMLGAQPSLETEETLCQNMLQEEGQQYLRDEVVLCLAKLQAASGNVSAGIDALLLSSADASAPPQTSITAFAAHLYALGHTHAAQKLTEGAIAAFQQQQEEEEMEGEDVAVLKTWAAFFALVSGDASKAAEMAQDVVAACGGHVKSDALAARAAAVLAQKAAVGHNV